MSVGAMRSKPGQSADALPAPNTDLNSGQTRVVMLFATMMVLVPALGWPNEELLQDTLKSMLVAFFALTAAMVYFWQIRHQTVTV